MEHTNEINELISALSKAQEMFPVFIKDKTVKVRTKSGAEYSYKYTDLAEILKGIMPVLSKNGLAITQGINHNNDCISITTMLLHTSGQFFKDTLNLPIVADTKNIIQSIGSSITYGRRYHISSILGIASEIDDDATSAGNGNAPKQTRGNGVDMRESKPPTYNTTSTDKATTKQIGMINSIFNEICKKTPLSTDQYRTCKLTFIASSQKIKGLSTSKNLLKSQASAVIDTLMKEPERVEKFISTYIDEVAK